MKTYGYLEGKNYYIYRSEDIIKKMFDSLNTEKQDEALSLLGIDTNDKPDIEVSYKEFVLPVFESVFPSNITTESISFVLLEKLVKKTDIEPLTVYTQNEILKKIATRTEKEILGTQIIDFIRTSRYIKIIRFLKYLDANSLNASTMPKEYSFITVRISFLGCG